jgi:hypothetical protein
LDLLRLAGWHWTDQNAQMDCSSYDEFSIDEAENRWTSSTEHCPISSRLFLGLCDRYGVKVGATDRAAFLQSVRHVSMKANAFRVETSDVHFNETRSAQTLTGIARRLAPAMVGVISDGHLKLRMNWVPRELQGINLRQATSKKQWRAFRCQLIDERGSRCEICGGTPASESDLDAHEDWDYKPFRQPPQALLLDVKLVCSLCHATIHYGLTSALIESGTLPQNYKEEVCFHFCQVNGVSRRSFNYHHVHAGGTWLDLNSRKGWKINQVAFGRYTRQIAKA